jgi:hypothetical protein
MSPMTMKTIAVVIATAIATMGKEFPSSVNRIQPVMIICVS